MQRERFSESIRDRIAYSEYGSVFILSDFSDIADTDVVRKAVTRMENNGTIVRVLRGVYYKPEYNMLLGEPVAPSPDKVAHAIARNYGWTIIPCGDTALNILGLSTQVPSCWEYVTDGAYRDYTYGNTTISFRKTTNKDISRLSYKTALTIQALKTLGKDGVTEPVIARLNRKFSREEKEQMLAEARSATSWVYERMKIICKDVS